MRVPAALTAACGVLLILGCLEFDEEHVSVEHDQAADRLILIVDYLGLHAGPHVDFSSRRETVEPSDIPESMEQLAQALGSNTVALSDTWPYFVSLDKVRESLAEPNDMMPEDVRRGLVRALEHVVVLNAGFRMDELAGISGGQVVIIERASEFIDTLNDLISAFVLARADRLAGAGPVTDAYGQAVVVAARAAQGHAWVTLEGHSIVLTAPLAEGRFRRARERLADELAVGADGTPEALLSRLRALLGNPMQVWHDEGTIRMRIGYVSEPSTLVAKACEGDYTDNLEEPIRNAYGLHLDDLLARYLVDPEATATTEAERAARIMAPRLSRDDRVRVLPHTHQLATDASEPGGAGGGATPAKPNGLQLDLGDGVTMDLVLIPAGEFLMGSPAGEANRKDDEQQHRVRITKPFYIGKYEVTNGQYQQFLRDSGYDGGGNADSDYLRHHSDWGKYAPTGADYPIVCVSWHNAQAFCDWLSRVTGQEVRLPTEAEWEYACRAGTTTRFHYGETLSTYQANYDGRYTHGTWPKGTYRGKSMPVGSLASNSWGLYDMHGNVWEWCQDGYSEDYYSRSPPTDPQGPTRGGSNVLRGGSWDLGSWGCRSAIRLRNYPTVANFCFGFRVAASPTP